MAYHNTHEFGTLAKDGVFLPKLSANKLYVIR